MFQVCMCTSASRTLTENNLIILLLCPLQAPVPLADVKIAPSNVASHTTQAMSNGLQPVGLRASLDDSDLEKSAEKC